VKKGNINFEKFPVAPWQFDILEIESKEKEKLLKEGVPQGAPSAFWGWSMSPRESGVGDEREKNGE
jgi:hypothetical protein